MIKSILILATLIFANIASASGGTYCTVDDDNIVIEVQLVNSRMPGSPVAQGGAFASVKEHLSTPWTFEATTDMSGWWNENGEIKMGFYKESETESAYLKIEVRSDEFGEEAYGIYSFTQNSKLVATGPITCSYE